MISQALISGSYIEEYTVSNFSIEVSASIDPLTGMVTPYFKDEHDFMPDDAHLEEPSSKVVIAGNEFPVFSRIFDYEVDIEHLKEYGIIN